MSGLIRHRPWRCLRQGADIAYSTLGFLSESNFNNISRLLRGLADIDLLYIPRSFNIP